VSWIPVVVGFWAALGGVALVVGARDRARQRRLYDERVGLDLPRLVALLPPQLQGRAYLEYRLAPGDGRSLTVGLIYRPEHRPGEIHQGTPPNVGLEFDLQTGALLAVHEDGVGLGVK